MSLFSRKSRRQIGVDIGTSSIKVVELARSGSHPRLVNYGVLDGLDFFGDIAVSSRSSSTFKTTDSEIVTAIKKLLVTSKIKTKEAVLSVPVFSSFLTVIELPFMSMKELDKAIQFQARSYIPVPISEVVLDWLALPPEINKNIVNPTKPKNLSPEHITPIEAKGKITIEKKTDSKQIDITFKKPNNISVLLVAVPKEVISRYQRIAAQAELVLKGLESESFSVVRSLIGNDPKAAMLIDLGARSTTLTIVDKGFVRMSHSVDLSGKEITTSIARGLNISAPRAEELKKSIGVTSKGVERGIVKLITPLVEKIVVEFNKMFNLHLRKNNKKIEKIVLTGGAANLPGLAEYLKDHLSIEVVIGDPFARINYPSNLKDTLQNKLGVSLAVSAGLAMRDS